MMRFVVLALAVLLAGCQARFLQDEQPSHLEHMKSKLQVYSDNMKQFAHRILANLDDTEFEDYKEFLGQSVDNIHNYFQHVFQAIIPVVAQVLEATTPMREKLTKSMEDLHKQIEPLREELKDVLEKHIQEYRDVLKPFVKVYLAKLMEKEKTKLEPVVKSLKEKIGHNWEETKSKLIPILEAVRNRVTARLQELKTQLEPYIQVFRDEMEQAALRFRHRVRSGELSKTLYEFAEEVKPHFQAIFIATQMAITKE
ncbi:apolipo A-I [Labeo rohita]|uniref:Apolipo A-I n=1 Tax=Labeo rohita TaxID=84645 RepID=A0A498MYF5_LABRO|nr:apolipo A-I [Labeo rohita]RXN25531.1 apolipo A-I [Labeo rohita]